jgi:hypothetical protein
MRNDLYELAGVLDSDAVAVDMLPIGLAADLTVSQGARLCDL